MPHIVVPSPIAHASLPSNASARPPPTKLRRATAIRLFLALVDADELVEHRQRLVARALEGVAADDRSFAAAVADVARVLIDRVGALGRTAREDVDPPSGEARLHHVRDIRD